MDSTTGVGQEGQRVLIYKIHKIMGGASETAYVQGPEFYTPGPNN